MRIGRVISSRKAINRDGDTPVLLLKVEISDPNDDQTVEYAQASGDDYNPPPDTTVIITELGEAWKIAIAGDDGIEPESDPGEREIYAHVGGVKKGRVKCKLDGIVEAGAAPAILDFVAQATKVHTEISKMLAAGAGAPGLGASNFAAAKAAWDLIFVLPLTGVASANFRSED